MKGREGLTEVERLPARDALATAARSLALAAVEAQRARFPGDIEGAALGIPAADANTSLGNAAEVLERGARSADEHELVSHLIVLGFASDFPSAPETERSSARTLLWLETHTGLSLLAPLLELSPRHPGPLRAALEELAEQRSRGVLPSEALVARQALDGDSRALEGELGATPRSGWLTVLQALTLWLFLTRSLRFAGRLLLGYRTPARAKLSARGLELEVRTELLGRKLRERSLVVPFAEIVSLTREARFARAGLYAGTASLALGTYIGGGLLMDALRTPGGSTSLLGLGLLLVIAGVALDFALSSFVGTAAGNCRLVILPKRGRGFTLARVAQGPADSLLRRVLSHASPPPASQSPEA